MFQAFVICKPSEFFIAQMTGLFYFTFFVDNAFWLFFSNHIARIIAHQGVRQELKTVFPKTALRQEVLPKQNSWFEKKTRR